MLNVLFIVLSIFLISGLTEVSIKLDTRTASCFILLNVLFIVLSIFLISRLTELSIKLDTLVASCFILLNVLSIFLISFLSVWSIDLNILLKLKCSVTSVAGLCFFIPEFFFICVFFFTLNSFLFVSFTFSNKSLR